MEYLAHRGLWTNKSEGNTFVALRDGLDKGFGLELDVRDFNGQLVISHDLPNADSLLPLEQLLEYYSEGGFGSTIALNIKADGLVSELSNILYQYGIRKYFVFDMSIPDTISYLKFGLHTFIRRSDLEFSPELELLGKGIWMDEMNVAWINQSAILEQVKKSDAVCIVSSELHGRERISQWKQIKNAISTPEVSEKLLLCTDFPYEAERFFNELD
jgi:hypothetical protein